MLAKAPPPSPPINFKFSGKVPGAPLPFINFNLQNQSSSGTKWTRRARVVVRAGYTRRDLETAGAYELIDDETGEKFIVWGGIDDNADLSPIPSKDVLRWKPSSKNNDGSNSRNIAGSNSNEDEYNYNNISQATNNRGGNGNGAFSKKLAGPFGKLKVQRVRGLVRKTSLKTQDINVRESDEKNIKDAPSQGHIGSHFEPEFVADDKSLDVIQERKFVSRATQSQETQDRMQKVVTKEDMDHSVTTIRHEVEQLSNAPTKFQDPDNGVPVSRVSAASLRGWSNGGSIHNFRDKPIEIPKKWMKSNADSEFFSRRSFRDMGCHDYMIESLRSQLFLRPSHIQAMAFAPVIEGKSCIIADQSGSGKTLAYLLPVIQRLRQEELQGLGKSLSQNPRVVVLVPTAELGSQVLSNCRLMSKSGVPFRSMVATGGFRQRTQLDNLRQELDVLIATPGRFMFLVKEGFLQLTNLKCAVLDEVDILFNDEDFDPVLQNLMSSAPVTTQYLFVTATLPVDIYNKLVEAFPDSEVIMGPGMHRTSPGLEEILVDCSGDDGAEKTPDTAFLNKKSALLRLVEESPVTKTIVFCNKIETCRKVENALKRFDRKGIRTRVLPFHAALEQESRLANMKEFRSSQSKDSALFLVCTDRASRGIDFAGVDHVVLFDFPRDPSEYVRRVGRTARGAGGIGKAFIFVVGKQVSLARRIIDRNRKGHPLHDVPSAYERMG